MSDIEQARAIIAEARQSHVAWRDHYAAHDASGAPCEQCREFPSDRNVAYEQRWIDNYDLLLRVLAALRAERDAVLALVSEQANDEGLWFRPKYATEDYLQRALRRLHSAVEGKHSAPPTPGGEPAGKE